MGLFEDIRKSDSELQEEAANAERQGSASAIVIIVSLALVLLVGLTYLGYTKYALYRNDKRLDAEGSVMKSGVVESCHYAPSTFLKFTYDHAWDVTYNFSLNGGPPYRGSGKCLKACLVGQTIEIKYVPENPNINKPNDSPRLSTFLGSEQFVVIVVATLCLSIFGWFVKKILRSMFDGKSN